MQEIDQKFIKSVIKWMKTHLNYEKKIVENCLKLIKNFTKMGNKFEKTVKVNENITRIGLHYKKKINKN